MSRSDDFKVASQTKCLVICDWGLLAKDYIKAGCPSSWDYISYIGENTDITFSRILSLDYLSYELVLGHGYGAALLTMAGNIYKNVVLIWSPISILCYKLRKARRHRLSIPVALIVDIKGRMWDLPTTSMAVNYKYAWVDVLEAWVFFDMSREFSRYMRGRIPAHEMCLLCG